MKMTLTASGKLKKLSWSLAIVLVLLDECMGQGSTDCSKDLEEILVDCSKKHLDDSLTVPTNVRDLTSKCLSFKEAGVCLKNYAYKCMDDEARIKTGLILSGISLVGGSFCGSQQDKEDFISHSRCLNSTASREIQCRKSFMQTLRVARFARNELKIPIACCYYNEFVKCLDSLFEESAMFCSQASYEYFREMTGKFRTSTIDMLCGSKYHRASEKCDVVVGSAINGRDILVKYLIGVFANRPEVDVRRITGRNPLFPWAMSRSEYLTSPIE